MRRAQRPPTRPHDILKLSLDQAHFFGTRTKVQATNLDLSLEFWEAVETMLRAYHRRAFAPLKASATEVRDMIFDVEIGLAHEVLYKLTTCPELCGNQISGAPRHRRDVVPVTAAARWRGG